jgi:hypothetical protein
MSGRNRINRRIAIDAIRHDPGWQDGSPPRGNQLK